MLYVFVRDVMDIVFFVCIGRRGAVGAPVSSRICCMFVSCVHHVAVLNAALCMTCSLLMLDKDARGNYMKEAYYKAGLMTVFLWKECHVDLL